MESTQHALPNAKTVEAELLHLLARQSRRVPIPVFLAAAMIAGLAAARVPTINWAAWLVLVGVVLATRWAVLGMLTDRSRFSEQQGLRIAIVLNAVNGVTHGLSLAFFPYLTDFERAVQSFLLIGLCAGSIATTAGSRPAFFAYLIPTLGPLAILWAVVPSDSGAGWISISTAIIIVLFSAVLIALSADANRLFRESFEIRLQHVELNRQLKAALEMAESASRAKTRFLASASHDLRQPVHTLSLFAAALEMRPLDARTREISQHIGTALQVLAAQLDSLLDVSKLDAGIVQVNPGTIEVEHLLERIAKEIGPDARAKGLDVTFDCPAGLKVETDAVLFERVIRNLTGNALKYTDSGEIRIDAVKQDESIILIISDTGRGIPDSEQARIFEEFYQVDNPERDRTKGLGLGLSIVRRLVHLLGIRMEMVSLEGKGTQFFLILPQSDGTHVTAPPVQQATFLSALLHILVIDDEASVQEGMRILLTSLGSRVSTADSTDTAAAAAAADRPDLILADLRLRGEDNGLIAIRAVRALYPDTPAILISGDTAPDRLREAEEAGIPLLHKPLHADVLKQAIAKAMTSDQDRAVA